MMNSDQLQRAYRDLLNVLRYDWVQLRAVVAIANEVVGFDDRRLSTPEARDFVAGLILEGKVVVGSLDDNAKFVKWTGSNKEHFDKVMDQMPLGTVVDQVEHVWFDQPDVEA